MRTSSCVTHSPTMTTWAVAWTFVALALNFMHLPCVTSFSRHLSTRINSSCPTSLKMTTFPELCVFDLDACFWDQEMYEMSELPSSTVKGDLNGRGEGVIGVMSGRNKISMHKGSLQALQDHYDGKFGGMKVAFASSADTPFAEKVGRASLKLLEVVPGTTVWDLVVGRDWDGVDVNQIGRQPPLSSNKAKTHFPRLKEATGIRFDRMLFFDDCNWGDHCGMVSAMCKEPDTGVGPATVRTPMGLGIEEWEKGLATYEAHATNLASQQQSK